MKQARFALFVVVGALAFAPLFASAQSGPAPTCRLTANTGVVQKGGTVNLTWSSTNALGGTLTSVGSIGPSGTQGVIPTRTTEYEAIFSGPGGTARCAVVIIVTTPQGGTTAPLPPAQQQPVESTSEGTFPTSGGQQSVSGQSEGLVPCTGLNCQACHLAKLTQNIIKFIIALTVPLAAILIAIAGAMYFTSSVGSKKEKAKAILRSALIGFVIALTSWLVINTLLNLLFDPIFKQGSTWFTIQCVEESARPQSGGIDTLINSVIGETPSLVTTFRPPVVGEAPIAQCPPNYSLIDNQCWGTQGENDVVQPSYTFANPSAAIAYGMDSYYAADTSAGPDNGNKACAWAVNNVLKSQGIAPVDGDSVALMEEQLRNRGRGAPVALSSAQKGDIIVWKGENAQGKQVSHVGFCENAGCTSAISNSSGSASFNNRSGSTLLGVEGRVYRVNN